MISKAWLFLLLGLLALSALLFGRSVALAEEETLTPTPTETFEPWMQTPTNELFNSPTTINTSQIDCNCGSMPVGWNTITPDFFWWSHCEECYRKCNQTIIATMTNINMYPSQIETNTEVPTNIVGPTFTKTDINTIAPTINGDVSLQCYGKYYDGIEQNCENNELHQAIRIDFDSKTSDSRQQVIGKIICTPEQSCRSLVDYYEEYDFYIMYINNIGQDETQEIYNNYGKDTNYPKNEDLGQIKSGVQYHFWRTDTSGSHSMIRYLASNYEVDGVMFNGALISVGGQGTEYLKGHITIYVDRPSGTQTPTISQTYCAPTPFADYCGSIPNPTMQSPEIEYPKWTTGGTSCPISVPSYYVPSNWFTDLLGIGGYNWPGIQICFVPIWFGTMSILGIQNIDLDILANVACVATVFFLLIGKK